MCEGSVESAKIVLCEVCVMCKVLSHLMPPTAMYLSINESFLLYWINLQLNSEEKHVRDRNVCVALLTRYFLPSTALYSPSEAGVFLFNGLKVHQQKETHWKSDQRQCCFIYTLLSPSIALLVLPGDAHQHPMEGEFIIYIRAFCVPRQ